MIKIINYGLGNVNAFLNTYKSLGIECEICQDKSSLKNASKIILPGVGSFDWAINRLNDSGMRDTLDQLVLEKKVPILGICVGMQIMLKGSEEGKEEGLNWIDATNLHLSKLLPKDVKLPHLGWNQVDNQDSILLKDIENPKFYFLHSYFISSNNINNIDAYTTYEKKFPCALSKNNQIFGVQFHPEKSHESGVKLLLNFANL